MKNLQQEDPYRSDLYETEKLLFLDFLNIYWKTTVKENPVDTGRKVVSERLMYVQFTSCVYWESF